MVVYGNSRAKNVGKDEKNDLASFCEGPVCVEKTQRQERIIFLKHQAFQVKVSKQDKL
jgi:hypothetical protein